MHDAALLGRSALLTEYRVVTTCLCSAVCSQCSQQAGAAPLLLCMHPQPHPQPHPHPHPPRRVMQAWLLFPVWCLRPLGSLLPWIMDTIRMTIVVAARGAVPDSV